MSGYAEAFSAAIQTTIQGAIDLGSLAQEPGALVTGAVALSGLALAALVTHRAQPSTSFDGLAQPGHALPTPQTSGSLGRVEARIAGSSAEAGAQGVLGVTTPGGGE